jgi:hypothetical protein
MYYVSAHRETLFCGAYDKRFPLWEIFKYWRRVSSSWLIRRGHLLPNPYYCAYSLLIQQFITCVDEAASSNICEPILSFSHESSSNKINDTNLISFQYIGNSRTGYVSLYSDMVSAASCTV